ncbi:lysyl oxidase family protein [Halosolutus amylolyticus]|uniref:Lysyl oxidase family protein n=1 Tax=Halosolutus amylolyticus TaxID=2932267 RepID=A0ABD5PPA0_9EURY|nr:lysyl oxidase family protein [Halosolutus amylolyticus]
MKRTDGRTRAAVLVAFLLIAVVGIGMITLAGVTADVPFTESVSDSNTDSSTASESEGTADEEATSANEENSTTPPLTPTESDSGASETDPDATETDPDAIETDSDASETDPEVSDDQIENGSGVNFVPAVRDLSISTEVFDESSPDVEDGYVTPGEHRLLRFDILTYNVGDADAELGNPEDNPDQFVHSDSHDHAHLDGFNNYTLFDESGNEMGVGKKQPFCLMDIQRMPSRPNASSSPQFDCDNQGISAGWADVYDSSLPGQYLVIDSLPDGNYTLQATTNAEGTIDENCYDDNSVRVGLRISEDSVTVTDAPESHLVRASDC